MKSAWPHFRWGSRAVPTFQAAPALAFDSISVKSASGMHPGQITQHSPSPRRHRRSLPAVRPHLQKIRAQHPAAISSAPAPFNNSSRCFQCSPATACPPCRCRKRPPRRCVPRRGQLAFRLLSSSEIVVVEPGDQPGRPLAADRLEVLLEKLRRLIAGQGHATWSAPDRPGRRPRKRKVGPRRRRVAPFSGPPGSFGFGSRQQRTDVPQHRRRVRACRRPESRPSTKEGDAA